MPATRRDFLQNVARRGNARRFRRHNATAIEPIHRTGRPQIRLSLAAYSFRQFLDLRRKPRPTMTLDDFIDMAAGLPLDAVELTAYYFANDAALFGRPQGPLHPPGPRHQRHGGRQQLLHDQRVATQGADRRR